MPTRTHNPINSFDIASLLRFAYRHALTAANADEAVLRLEEKTGATLDPTAFHAAVAEAVATGLIREPVRLPDGALQCQWRLELTPQGLARARDLIGP